MFKQFHEVRPLFGGVDILWEAAHVDKQGGNSQLFADRISYFRVFLEIVMLVGRVCQPQQQYLDIVMIVDIGLNFGRIEIIIEDRMIDNFVDQAELVSIVGLFENFEK